MKVGQRFNWEGYRQKINVDELPFLKQREELLLRERELMKKGRDNYKTEQKILENLSAIIPTIKAQQTAETINASVKTLLPTAKYEVRDEQGHVRALASDLDQLGDVLEKLGVARANRSKTYLQNQFQQPGNINQAYSYTRHGRLVAKGNRTFFEVHGDVSFVDATGTRAQVDNEPFTVMLVSHGSRREIPSNVRTKDLLENTNRQLLHPKVMASFYAPPPGTIPRTTIASKGTTYKTTPSGSKTGTGSLVAKTSGPIGGTPPPSALPPGVPPLPGLPAHLTSGGTTHKSPTKASLLKQVPDTAIGVEHLPPGYYLSQESGSGDYYLWHVGNNISIAKFYGSTYGTNYNYAKNPKSRVLINRAFESF